MRLWHTDLIEVLPRQQLLGQWRELNSIFKLQNRHVLINFVYDYDPEDLYSYSVKVLKEMKKRGYKFNLDNFRKFFNGKNYCETKKPFRWKMTARYFWQCYYNLQEKYDCGGITAEEWAEIEKVEEKRKKVFYNSNLHLIEQGEAYTDKELKSDLAGLLLANSINQIGKKEDLLSATVSAQVYESPLSNEEIEYIANGYKRNDSMYFLKGVLTTRYKVLEYIKKYAFKLKAEISVE